MTCRCCQKGADVAVHVENSDPLLYCDPCRKADRPQDRFKIVDELRLTRPHQERP